jgi:hypothetical protein
MNESSGTSGRLFGSSGDSEELCFRAWPCPRCRQGLTTLSYLISRQRSDPAFRNDSIEEKIRKEVGWLHSWTETCPHSEKKFPVAELTSGSEHQVYLEQQFGCIVKCALPGLYGDKYFIKDRKVWQQACTPYESLTRRRKCIFTPKRLDCGKGRLLALENGR